MSLALANRYARAFVEALLSPAAAVSPEQGLDQVRAFEDLLAASSELRNVLLSPAVPPARKRAVVGNLAQPLGLAPTVRNFLFVVMDHRRVPLLSRIREAARAVLDERTGLVRASIASAQRLSPPQQERIRQGLAALTGRQVRCDYAEDPALVGGVIARIGSTVYDGSVHGQLETLRQKLVNT
jgi:F-type H+-transporting ATPase subunit delta